MSDKVVRADFQKKERRDSCGDKSSGGKSREVRCDSAFGVDGDAIDFEIENGLEQGLRDLVGLESDECDSCYECRDEEGHSAKKPSSQD